MICPECSLHLVDVFNPVPRNIPGSGELIRF